MLPPEPPVDTIRQGKFQARPGAKADFHGEPEKTPFFPVHRSNQIFVPWKRSSAASALRS